MADDRERVTVRHKSTKQEREVAKSAVAYWPDWEVLDSIGRVNPKATPTTTKEN